MFIFSDYKLTFLAFVKVIKVQSKGRNIINNESNVRIYKHYVTADFVCFLYLKTEDRDID